MAPFTCLMYHSLSDGRWPDTQYLKYTVSRNQLRDHLAMLTGEGYFLAGFDDFLRRADAGEALPPRYCLLSFDDGHRSSLDIADILSESGAGATFFLTMDYCRGREDFLGATEILDLLSMGFDLGAHGKTHRALSEMPPEEMRSELESSKRWLEDIVQAPVSSMSLPAGMGNRAVLDAAFKSGHRLVGDSQETSNRHPLPPGPVHRFCVRSTHGTGAVLAMASGSRWHTFRRAVRAKLIAIPKRILRTYNRTRG